MVLIARECGINASLSGHCSGGHGGGQFLHQLGRDHRSHAIDIVCRVQFHHVAADDRGVEIKQDVDDLADGEPSRFMV